VTEDEAAVGDEFEALGVRRRQGLDEEGAPLLPLTGRRRRRRRGRRGVEEGGGRPPRPPRSLGERRIRAMERPSRRRRRRCGGNRAAHARRRSDGFASLGDAVMMLTTGITGEGKCPPVEGDGKSRRGVHGINKFAEFERGEFALGCWWTSRKRE